MCVSKLNHYDHIDEENIGSAFIDDEVEKLIKDKENIKEL